MKNCKSALLFLTSLLMLSACGGSNPKEDDPKKDDPKVDPDVEVLDAGNTQVSFASITEPFVSINDKAKAYIDKMKEQEKASENPYFFTALDGNDNVEVKNELSQNDADKDPKPVTISWEKGTMSYDKIKLLLCRDWKFEEGNTFEFETEGTEVKIYNLRRAYTYYYRLENADKSIQSQVQKFETADYVRHINWNYAQKLNESIYNVRDEGGYISSFGGVRTNQGLIYRGSELTDKQFSYSGTHKVNIDDNVVKINRDVIKIGVELDLRKDDGAGYIEDSPFNTYFTNNTTELNAADFPTVDYYRMPFNNYYKFVNDPNNGIENNLKNAFDLLANADKKHVYFHCWGGADRTGALGFFLNGLLGVSYTDMLIDFELTTQYNSLRSHLTKNGDYDMPKMLQTIRAHELYSDDKPIAQFCKEFLMANGVAEETLEHIREIMIPGYKTGMEQTF